MNFIIVTGMSGAGKSLALKYLEDLSFFCVDNLPPSLIPEFIEIYSRAEFDINKVALGIDIRGGKLFNDLFTVLDELKHKKVSYKILFLDAADEVLTDRYKESRRTHPLANSERLVVSIDKERQILQDVKQRADYIIDTSYIMSRQLKEQINDIFMDNKEFHSLMITVLSFGFKYGIPRDSDLVFDVRFLKNPYYVKELKPLTGNDVLVSDFVKSTDVYTEFFSHLLNMIEFLIPNYISEGKNQLVISIGCTGGKHRSVTMANHLFKTLQNFGHSAIILHRDIDKDALKN